MLQTSFTLLAMYKKNSIINIQNERGVYYGRFKGCYWL